MPHETPKRKLIQGKRLFVSLGLAAGTNVLRYWPWARDKLDALADWVGQFFPLGYDWIAHVVLFTTASLIIYAILWGPIGDFLYGYWRRAAASMGIGLRWVLRWKKGYYTEEERNRGEFRRDLLGSIDSTKVIYCLLFAGYTMVHEEREKFLLGRLFDLNSAVKANMDIRFLFLRRNSPRWAARAEEMVRRTAGLVDVNSYKQMCEEAETMIRGILPKAQIRFYDDLPSWRLHIFTERLFASYYSGPPDGDFAHGHLQTAIAYDSDHEMYAWLKSEFVRLWESASENP